MGHEHRSAEVVRFDSPPEAAIEDLCNWEQPPWSGVEPLDVANVMGDRPDFVPATSAKLAWDNAAVYVIFHVEDQYVRAVAQKHQDSVCTDSCVEFFFCPGKDASSGYFNLEINCGGTILLNFQTVPRVDQQPLPIEAIEQIQVSRSLPATVDPEITEPVIWTVECRLPYEILKPHLAFDSPQAGDTWLGNLYKCGDKTSNPHWLTWSAIDLPTPDFHVPDAFGTLGFTD
jgi:hypothetical protein